MQRQTQRLILAAVFLLAIATFFTGINWGLPSRESDSILFGSKTPWTGQQIMDLAGAWDTTGSRGADIAMHPLDARERNQPIVLNDTDAKRAEIVRRYRLYSNQPDEMITFRSLSRMKPGKLDFDPRMYQYGGLWIYPIGVILKAASIVGLVTLRTDLAFYLDHPEAFARFYLVARIYAASWGLIGVIVVYALVREWTGEFLAGATAAGIYAAMPVVINLAHEAKPHLPGAVLTLLTILMAMRYVRTGQNRWWILAGAFAGTAMGMILTGYVAFIVLPVMTLLRPSDWKSRLKITAASTLIGIAIFTLSNPYLPYNLLLHREVLHSNVGNYGTFYQPRFSISSLMLTARLLMLGTSPAPLALGLLATTVLNNLTRSGTCQIRPRRREEREGRREEIQKDYKNHAILNLLRAFAVAFVCRLYRVIAHDYLVRLRTNCGLLFAAPAILVLIQFILLAEGKQAEYARFALLPDVTFAVLTGALIARLKINAREKALAAAWIVAATLYFGVRYDLNFVADGWSDSTRHVAAQKIEEQKSTSNRLAIWAEPAPYCLPPVDLFHWQLILLPRGLAAAQGQVSIRAVDDPASAHASRPLSPISWANKPFEILSAH